MSKRVAVVTGGIGGLGTEICVALARAGRSVIAADLGARAERIEQFARDVEDLDIRFEALDAGDFEACGALVRKVEADLGALDILVNAAGINLRQPFAEVTAAAFDLHVAIHLRAPFLLTQRLAPAMRDRGWGRIVNLASLQSTRAFADGAPYGAAKGGIVQLTRAIAQAWSPHGITCNAIGPDFFPTPLTAPVFADPARAAANAAQTAIGRNGRLDDLYGATVFLASDASAYVTGQTLMIDGGFTAR